MLADKESVESGAAEAREIVMRAQTGFTDGDAIFGNGLDQRERGFEMDLKIAEIAIIDADDAGACGDDAVELLARVNFDERLHLQRAAEFEEFPQSCVREDCGD